MLHVTKGKRIDTMQTHRTHVVCFSRETNWHC